MSSKNNIYILFDFLKDWPSFAQYFRGVAYGTGLWWVMVVIILSCSRPSPPVYSGAKIKGVNLVAPPRKIQKEAFESVRQVKAEWVAVIPYSFCRPSEPRLRFSAQGQWWGETVSGVAATIQMAHDKGLKVMLKPHVWVASGAYTGDFDLSTDADWQLYEKDFAAYVLTYARVADSLQVEMYCIATEMDNFINKRPQFWQSLIEQVRKVYKGPLTYAANWGHYQQPRFWQSLDFIGVDAYFPLSKDPRPSLQMIREGWTPHLKQLEDFAAQHQKPILFTELGYRSMDYATDKPWESHRAAPENQTVQADAYAAFFGEVWPRQWLAGVFIWKWFLYEPHHHDGLDAYSPQTKLAEKSLYHGFDNSVVPKK